MYLTGQNFRLTPEVNKMRLTFNQLTLFGTGRAEIGVSGNGNSLTFIFSGGKILSPDNKFFASYNSGEPFDFEWNIDTGNYQYLINDEIIANRKTKSNFNIQKFVVNSPSGGSISSDFQFFCEGFNYTIDINDSFIALSPVTGYISNSNSNQFRVFGNSFRFYNTNTELLSGSVTGNVNSSNTLSFSFADLNTSRFDSDVRFLLQLDTSIGELTGDFTTSRVSGLDITTSKLLASESNLLLSGLFDGSGISGNVFNFVPVPASHLISYYASKNNLRGENSEKYVGIQFEALTPTGSQAYLSEYVTGFNLTSSGEYLYPPIARFTGYYYVTGLDWALNSIILSSGCSGTIPVRFSGINNLGTGASGNLTVTKTYLSGIYGEGLNTYYLPTSFSVVTGGTGYIVPPKALLQTGLYSNCYDVGAVYGTTYLVFQPFTGAGAVDYQAGYLTGEVLTQTGLVSGGSLTGYRVTGIRFTNPGFGYSTGLQPKVSFQRRTGDNLTGNASGILLLKNSGTYSFSNFWSIETGISNFDLQTMSGTSGTAYMQATDGYLSIMVNYSGLDNTYPVVSRLTVSMTGADTITHLITGSKRYDLSTGFLKKKNNLELITFQPYTELNFFLTQDELDEYYSSSEYLNNDTTINLGDLDF